MIEPSRYCRLCLESSDPISSIYLHVQQKYLPSVIENLCGVVISPYEEPGALVCNECSISILNADEIVAKCLESNKLLEDRRNVFKKIEKLHQNQYEHQQQYSKAKKEEEWLSPHSVPLCKEEQEENIFDEVLEDQQSYNYSDNDVINPEMLVESILENSLHDSDGKTNTTNKRRSRKKLKKVHVDETCNDFSQNPAALMYQSHFKTSKPKKSFTRSREQYLKRKIRNYPVKEPLTLIGGEGVVRKRKPKSYHRAIPNFYFRCELCHEFESNVASYAVTHLTTVHDIKRPAIFRCSLCDAKPFIKNQSLQEHIATIHEQQPKKRNFACPECGKTFIKNCHLQKHLLSVHKIGEMPYRCNIVQCGKGYVDAYALKMHLKQTHQQVHPEILEIHRTQLCVDDKSLKNHTMDISHDAQCYNCLQCGYNFRQKSRYEAHIRRATCKPPCFVCRFCERTFVKLVQLEEHQRENHSV
ncbi:zinc finger protein 234 [Stomoxys calcitrans]|uniref:Protein krueppel n=1 Tax=Stomoxys calcitrans TaxID=35570 RepID=A0A1I8PUE0_STOCA|nr:zinc finger protein 234 [Stomoxys calcitrans]